MSFAVTKPVIRLRQLYRWLFGTVIVATLAITGLSTLMFVPTFSMQRALLLGPLLAAYLIRKGYTGFKAQRAVRQFRLEEQFLRQNLGPMQLRQCLFEKNHLWQRSLVLRGLKGILARPLPRLLRSQEKERRVRRQFNHTLSFFQLPAYNPDILFTLVLFAAWFILLGSQAPPGTWTPTYTAVTASAGAMFALELLQFILQRKLLARYDETEEALYNWTVSQRFEQTLRTIHHQLYTHRALYQAQPWFTSPDD